MSDDKKHQDWLNTYKKIRKPLPPPDKIIKPKNKEPETFNWRAKERKEEEYKSIDKQIERWRAAGSSAPACWPLPSEWATFIPPQAVIIKHETVSAALGGGSLTRPVWNEQWLRGLEAYVRGIVRDELSKANASGQTPAAQEKPHE